MTVFRLARSPVVSVIGNTRVLGAPSWAETNQAPSWGSASGAVFNLKQGETLNMANALRFTDPDGDPLTITHITGALPANVTYDPATGLITAAATATVGLSTDLVFQADDTHQSIKDVGPGKPYATIRSAILAAQDGDIINITGGDYIGDVATITANNLLIRGADVNNRARLFANGVHQSDKGILVLQSNNVTFENMDFHDAAGPSQNIAGVRHDGAGLTTFRRCGFFDCENGILSGGGGTVLMEFCEFARNGFGDGQTHNVYFGQHSLVTARDCYFHEAHIGHEFKSRAKENVLERCYIVNGPTGDASYLVNADNGGRLIMRGCMLQKSTNADNSNSIFHNTNTWGTSFNSITLEHCTLVHEYPTGSFINLASGSTAVTLTACLFASNGRPLVTGATPTQNSNFHTVVASIPSANVIADPDFWPVSTIHADLELPAAVVPTYLTDEPNIFTPRSLGSPPKVIGAIQNVLVTGAADFWSMPSLQDERDLYENVLNWDRVTSAAINESFAGFSSGPLGPYSESNIHGNTENDDLWTWYNQKRRGYNGAHPSASLVSNWCDRFTTYYRDGGYRADGAIGDWGGSSNFHADHLYGYGLVLHAFLENDTVAMAEAEALGDIGINHWSVNHDNVTFRTPGASSVFMHGPGGRKEARSWLLMTYLAQATGKQKWIDWRDNHIDCWIQTPADIWQDDTTPGLGIVQGGHYFVPRGMLPFNGNGDVTDWDAGRRFSSTFMMALINEAHWMAYLATGRADLRNRIIKMARFVQYYGHDPSDTVHFSGTGLVGQPSGGPFVSSYFGAQTGGPYYHRHVNEPDASAEPTASYSYAYADMQVVNTLVRGYKLTGDVALLNRAKVHFRQGSRWAQLQPGSSGEGPLVPVDEVVRFIDTKSDNTNKVFDQDKGQLMYCWQLMENGGNPSVIP